MRALKRGAFPVVVGEGSGGVLTVAIADVTRQSVYVYSRTASFRYQLRRTIRAINLFAECDLDPLTVSRPAVLPAADYTRTYTWVALVWFHTDGCRFVTLQELIKHHALAKNDYMLLPPEQKFYFFN